MKLLRQLLTRIGEWLPSILQRPFHRYLYDNPLPAPVDERARFKLPAPEEDPLPVVFKFVGGCREGALATLSYWGSDRGRIGARFKVASEASVDAMLVGESAGPILQHEYEIVDNRVHNGVRIVRAEAR